MDYMRRTNMTRRPQTQEQATKQINDLEAKLEANEAEAMKLVGHLTPISVGINEARGTAEFRELVEKSHALADELHALVLLRPTLPTQAQWEYEADMRLQEQIANDPYGGDDFMAYNMMGDCW